FFQAEDGIRDFHVTGVQTCALPISVSTVDGPCPLPRTRPVSSSTARSLVYVLPKSISSAAGPMLTTRPFACPRRGRRNPDPARRSEERRVGKGNGTRGRRQV